METDGTECNFRGTKISSLRCNAVLLPYLEVPDPVLIIRKVR